MANAQTVRLALCWEWYTLKKNELEVNMHASVVTLNLGSSIWIQWTLDLHITFSVDNKRQMITWMNFCIIGCRKLLHWTCWMLGFLSQSVCFSLLMRFDMQRVWWSQVQSQNTGLTRWLTVLQLSEPHNNYWHSLKKCLWYVIRIASSEFPLCWFCYG